MKPLKWYKSLHNHKGRYAGRAFLVEGLRAISQIQRSSPSHIIEILYDNSSAYELLPDTPIRELSAQQIKSITHSKTPQGILAVVELPAETYRADLPDNAGEKILLLEDIQDPGNVGTLIRSAAAFGFSGIILSDKCADPFSPKSVQATAGTLLSVWIRRTAGYRAMAAELKKDGYSLLATDVEGAALQEVTQKCVLCLGNEGQGLSLSLRESADSILSVPIDTSRAESLNVAAAGAVCMYALGAKEL